MKNGKIDFSREKKIYLKFVGATQIGTNDAVSFFLTRITRRVQ